MNEDNSILSPQPQATPVQKNELPSLSPENNYKTPSTTRNFPVSDSNLKPLEVNLPKDIPAPVQPTQTPISPPSQPSDPQLTTLPTLVPGQQAQALPPITSTEQPQVFVNPNPPPPTDVS